MAFTGAGLVLAMPCGVFFGSEGELPEGVQERIFLGLILVGVMLHGLQNAVEVFCHRYRLWICRTR